MRYDEYECTDKKLGMIYSTNKTTFRVWSPTRGHIDVYIYPNQYSIERTSYPMEKGRDGVHEVSIEGNIKGHFYTFLLDKIIEVTDPYSVASSLNSIRSAIVDLKDTNPPGWENHTIPYNRRNCDAIIYEVHVKDFTASETSGALKRGKYLGFIENNTKYNEVYTGLSHLKELGVTHVHIMPVHDFISVKEEDDLFFDSNNYNWGYDPELYNVPEGSYASFPEGPASRIIDLKTMIMGLHEAGLKVILDVVYNHTYKSHDSNFNMIFPNYYYRNQQDGSFSNGSGVGNELASERPMVRKFIIDSLLYWVNEYKVDGFRFDLMALIDIDTVEEAIISLRKIKPDIFIYGEPWTGGVTSLPYTKTTTKGTQGNLSFAFFNDNFRDAIKGDNDGHTLGFTQGNLDYKLATETGITGSIYYDDGHIGFASHPRETINYLNSHDNLILTDKIRNALPEIDDEGIKRLSKFAFSILLTSQGIPFIHAGNEFLRTKKMIHNSYNSDLSINAIDWSLKEKNSDYYHYFKDLITLRMSYKAFRMTSVDEIRKRLKFIENPGACTLIAYTIEINEKQEYILVVHNGNPQDCFIAKATLNDHLKNFYGFKEDTFSISTILDDMGLVKDVNVEYDPYGIEVPYYSTKVYKLS